MTLPARYWAKVVATPGCAFWVGALSDGGYGRWDAGGDHIVSAHKALWEDVHGPLPAGVILLHACDETSCVRLSCLSPGDQLANQGQMARRGRTANQWARGCGDGRGPGGRARAIRAALANGYDEVTFGVALAAGDVRRDQLRLDLWPETPALLPLG